MFSSAGLRCLIATVVLASTAARAVVIETPTLWTGLGPDRRWTSGSNWHLGTPPRNDGTALVQFGPSPWPLVEVNASQHVKGLTFDFSSTLNTMSFGGYTLVGSSASTLKIGSSGLSIVGISLPTLSMASSGTSSTNSSSSYGYSSVYLDSSLGIILGADQTWTVPYSSSLSVAGTVSGTGKLTIEGEGGVDLRGNNTYTGGTVLRGAAVGLGSDTALGTGMVTIEQAGELSSELFTQGDRTIANPFTLNGALEVVSWDGFLKLTGAITLAQQSIRITNNGDEALFLDGNISQPGTEPRGLYLDGYNAVVFSGNNTYSGGTTVDYGAAIFRHAASVPAQGQLRSSSNGYVGIAFNTGTKSGFLDKFDRTQTYGTIGFDTDPSAANATTFAEPIDLTGFNSWVQLGTSTRAILTGTVTPVVGSGYRFGGGGGSMTVQSKLTGQNSLTADSGPGVELTINVVNPNFVSTSTQTAPWHDYTGTTTAANAAIVFGPAALSTGSAAGSFYLDAGGYIGSHDASPADFIPKFSSSITTGVIGFDSPTSTPRTIGEINLALIDPIGVATLSFTPIRTLAIGTTTAAKLTGTITLPAGQTDYYFTGYKGGVLEIATTLVGTRAVHIGDDFGDYPALDPNDDTRISTVFLNGANIHTGGTKLNSGRLVLGNATALGTGPLTISHNYIQDSLPRLETSLTTTPTFTNAIIVENEFEIGGVNAFTLAGNLSDPNSGGWSTLWKHGAFNLTLAGDNSSYSGGFHIAAGTLTFSGTHAAGSGDGWLEFGPVGGTAKFIAGSVAATPTIGGLESYSNAARVEINAGVTLKIDQHEDSLYKGSLDGAGALVKTGSGTLRLEKAGTLAGGTTIAYGTIDYAATGALGTGPVKLDGYGAALALGHGTTLANSLSFGTSGGLLSGNGSFGSAVVLGSNSGVSPGHSIGQLTFANDLTLKSGSFYEIEISDATDVPGLGYDTLHVAGILKFEATLSTPVEFSLTALTQSGASGNLANFIATQSYSWRIISTTGGILGFTPGIVDLDIDGFANVFGGTFSLALSGNNLMLNFTPVPEPSTWALMIAGLGLVLVTAIRRRRG